MNALIGYTGFVGSNLDKQYNFDKRYNSKNISEIKNQEFDILVCAGVRAEKYLANKYPEKDLEAITGLIDILKTVKAKKFILISTIDVYKVPINVDENTEINENGLHAYGLNRRYLEKWIKSYFEDYLIVRLPALFGKGLKKNFIYDLMTKIPTMVIDSKMQELLPQFTDKELLLCAYNKDQNGNYIFDKNIADHDKELLIEQLERVGFTSLVFTHSESIFPFYYLKNLWHHLEIAVDNNLNELNLAVEPISAKEIAKECFEITFSNIINGREPIMYDMKTVHYKLFNGKDGYIANKEVVLNQIKEFINEE